MRKCQCGCHPENLTTEYRLMLGSYHEGVSIREVLVNSAGIIVDWDHEPIFTPVSSVADVKRQLIEEMRDLDEMLEATDKPILDEAKLKL